MSSAPPEMRFASELVAGVSHLYRDQLLWWPTCAVAGCLFAFGFLESLVYAITDAFARPATFVGVIVSVQGIGALAGGLLSNRVVTRLGHVQAIVLALALFAVSIAAMAVAPNMTIVVLAAVPLGFGLPVLIVAINTLVQVRTPNRLMGRVSTTFSALIGTPQVLSIAIGAGLVATIDYHLLLGGMAALLVLLSVCLGAWARTQTKSATRTHPITAPSA